MNRFIRLIACSILVFAPVLTFAQGNSQQMQWGGMMNQEQMQQMHQNMLQMQELQQQMHNAAPGGDRDRLRDQHMDHMRQHMDMMRGGMMGQGQGMTGQGMMGNRQGMMGQGIMGNRQSVNGSQDNNQSGSPQQPRGSGDMSVEQRIERMESRMDQMQLMMEQMLGHMESNRRPR